jgi:hypothetical protein
VQERKDFLFPWRLQTSPAGRPISKAASAEPEPIKAVSVEAASIEAASTEGKAASTEGKAASAKGKAAVAEIITPPHESAGLGDVPLADDVGVVEVGGVAAVGTVPAKVRVRVVANRRSAIMAVVECLVAVRVCVVATVVVVEGGKGESISMAATFAHVNVFRIHFIRRRSGGNDFKDTREGDNDEGEEDKDLGHVGKGAESSESFLRVF